MWNKEKTKHIYNYYIIQFKIDLVATEHMITINMPIPDKIIHEHKTSFYFWIL